MYIYVYIYMYIYVYIYIGDLKANAEKKNTLKISKNHSQN